MYKRTLQQEIERRIGSGKAIIITGPRQAGKTTLIETVLQGREYLLLNGDDPKTRSLLTYPNTEQIRDILGKHKFVFIDESQRIEGIGLTMKIITDQFRHIQLFASGSSAFDLSNQINEPLTGRKWEYQLFPLSWEEYESMHGFLQAELQLENRLLYGFYPDALKNPGDEVAVLRNLVSSYLYKDILAQSGIRKPEVLEKLVQALALQVGSEVNHTELAQTVGIDKNTVANYISLLEKAYIVFTLGGFGRNLRTEIRHKRKVYFYDNGVRNMVLGNFAPLDLRPDKGALWENFLIAEKVKRNAYGKSLARIYFWRNQQQQEIDLVEENEGVIKGFEFKWKRRGRNTLPRTFVSTYNAECQIIDRDNFRDFVLHR